MKISGWLFLILSWGMVIFWTIWCLRRVLTSKRHWTHPEEDIEKLHHGEFEEPPPEK